MDPQEFRLQRVQVYCDIPESPLFWEATANVVNMHIRRYDDWGRGSKGFSLGSADKKINVRLFRDYITASIESLPKEPEEMIEILKSFSDNSLAVIVDALTAYGYDNVIEATYRYRFFGPVESTAHLIRTMTGTLVFIPNEYRSKFGGGPVDLSWGATFPYRDFECSIWVYGANRKVIRDAFPISADECGENGIIITVLFGLPGNQETLSLAGLEALFRIPTEELFDIIDLIIKSIRE